MQSEPGNAPLFSVVITTFNRADIVMQAVNSALAQEFSSFEVVVVDDGSTDNTPEVLAACDDPRLHAIRTVNGGISASKNAGGKHASGRFLVFLDSDDEALPGWLNRFAELIDDTDCAIAWCAAELERPGMPRATVVPSQFEACFDDFRGVLLTGTFALDRDAFLAVGGFREGLAASTLSEFFLRLLPYCTDHGLLAADCDEANVLIHQQEASGRPARPPQKLADSVCTIIDLHRERLERSPGFLADCYAMAGVNRARTGEFKEARRLFLMALRAKPRAPKNVGRLLLALVPPIASRVWDTQAYRSVAALPVDA